MRIPLKMKLNNGKEATIDLKAKSKCKFCKVEIYWGNVDGSTKRLPIDLLFDEKGVLDRARLHFSSCKTMKEQKQSKTPTSCPKCKGTDFDHTIVQAKDKKIHILRICKNTECGYKFNIPSTPENFKFVAKEPKY